MSEKWVRTVDLPVELRPIFEQLAKQNDGSVNREIVRACREYAKRNGGDKGNGGDSSGYDTEPVDVTGWPRLTPAPFRKED